MLDNCIWCGRLTEFICDSCGDPLCDECCVPYTQFNLLEKNICKDCYDSIYNLRYDSNTQTISKVNIGIKYNLK